MRRHSRVLVATLLDLNAEDETLVASRIAAFVRFAGSEPHTFLFTQALLHRLQQQTDNAPWLRRLSSDLATAVVPQYVVATHPHDADTFTSTTHTLPYVACPMSRVLCRAPCVACPVLRALCRVPYVACPMSRALCRVPRAAS